ncbi:hypothetical protein CAL7102_07652 [Dulcicalothrix desertica PCC 7102]|nr:hypothetical protein CAL7102_07652 [Dulcicalothrix desertica PCC 7102]
MLHKYYHKFVWLFGACCVFKKVKTSISLTITDFSAYAVERDESHWYTYMIQPITVEQTFVTNLEKFLSKADKFVKIYYAGASDKEDIQKIMCEVKALALDVDLEQLELEYQLYCDKKDLMADCDEKAWW